MPLWEAVCYRDLFLCFENKKVYISFVEEKYLCNNEWEIILLLLMKINNMRIIISMSLLQHDNILLCGIINTQNYLFQRVVWTAVLSSYTLAYGISRFSEFINMILLLLLLSLPSLFIIRDHNRICAGNNSLSSFPALFFLRTASTSVIYYEFFEQFKIDFFFNANLIGSHCLPELFHFQLY